VFGLVPAWQSSKPDVIPELKGMTAQLGGVEMRRFLIVFQIALSMMILFAAGLMTRTLSQLKTIDLGFDPARVITLRIDPAMAGYTTEQTDRVFDDILQRLRSQPNMTAASLAVVTPLEGSMISLNFEVPGYVAKSSDRQTNFDMISPQYFKTLNQALLAGREFSERDVKKGQRVAVVNQLFAGQYMPGQNPIGRHFKMGDDDIEIVGLVKNSRYQDLREAMWPLIYLPAKQTQSSGYTLLVRTKLMPKQAMADIEHTVRSVDAKMPIYDVREFQDLVDGGITSERALTFLSSLFSGLVTLLCCMGVYGLIAYAVSRRTREVGVRFAIGAQKSDVAKLFMRESAVLIVAGIVVGIPLALGSARVLKSLLYGVEPTDAPTLALTVAIFLGAGVLASLLPVRKATRIEPMQALRYE
jgi:predicted permease